MTNGEKLKEIFPSIELYEKSHDAIKIKFGSFWWNAEYKEPTTKNDLVVEDCVSRAEVHNMLENLPITVENKWFNWLQKACMRLADLPSVTPQLSSELEKNSKKLEKDFGELDCISRADAIQAMQDKAKKLSNEDTINGLCGAVAILFDLPPVTPIRPKGHWIDTKEISTNRRGQIVHEVICSECNGIAYFRSMINKYIGANICPNCGADMREVEK